MAFTAPAQIITAPAQLITAPAQPPTMGVTVCTALLTYTRILQIFLPLTEGSW